MLRPYTPTSHWRLPRLRSRRRWLRRGRLRGGVDEPAATHAGSQVEPVDDGVALHDDGVADVEVAGLDRLDVDSAGDRVAVIADEADQDPQRIAAAEPPGGELCLHEEL